MFYKNFNSKEIKSNNKKDLDEGFILVANTSKYLFHYRLLLIKKLNIYFKNVFILAPVDKSSDKLKEISKYIPWHLSNKKDFDLFLFDKVLFLLLKEIRPIKPAIVHSHTIKPNLLISVLNSFLGLRTVLSFPGMGRLSTARGIKNLF